MPLKLMFITNDPDAAVLAEQAGVDRIFIDLETRGKKERQGHLDTVISNFNFEDIKKVKKSLKKSKIITRINPLYDETEIEVEKAIDCGTDIIMLPMFKTKNEVKKFITFVDGRVQTCLLLETSQSLVRVHEILEVKGIDEIHIGLNDLHLSLGLDFMFELLSGGIVEYLCNIIRKSGIKYGFGGIARIGEGALPAEHIIAEHIRLGSEMVILSRSFHKKSSSIDDLKRNINFKEEVKRIKDTEIRMLGWTKGQFDFNKEIIRKEVRMLVESK